MEEEQKEGSETASDPITKATDDNEEAKSSEGNSHLSEGSVTKFLETKAKENKLPVSRK